MFDKRETEVLVVGAGPVGLLAGLALAERGVALEIVDSQFQTTSRSYALALHPRSLDLLGRLGLAEELVAAGHRVERVAFYEGAERRGELRFAALGGAHPFLLVLPQRAAEQALEQRLARHKVEIHWSHRLAGLETAGMPPVIARVDKLGKDSTGYSTAETGWVVDKTLTWRSGFVLGTDGHRSAVRRALDLDYPLVGTAQLFAVFELVTDAEPLDEVRVVFGEGGTANVLWPLGGGRFRWSFQVLGAEAEEVPRVKSRLSVSIGEDRYPFLGEEMLHRYVAERAPWFTAAIREVPWSVGIRFEKRLASGFGRGRVWLAGDAGHLAGPVGMHSMNLGLAEAERLAELADEVLHRGGGECCLSGYGEGREREWRQLLGLESAPRATPAAPEWARRHAAEILACVPASGEHLRALLAQVGLELDLAEGGLKA